MKKRTMLVLGTALLAVIVAPVIALVVGLTWDRGGGDSSGEFPEFVYYSESTEAAYRHAAEHQPLFAHVNCYCGCVNLADVPHRNLLDCFMNDDGTFDPHAVGCSVCIDIADDAIAWQAAGKTAEEIASLIDDEYEGVGPPTRG